MLLSPHYAVLQRWSAKLELFVAAIHHFGLKRRSAAWNFPPVHLTLLRLLVRSSKQITEASLRPAPLHLLLSLSFLDSLPSSFFFFKLHSTDAASTELKAIVAWLFMSHAERAGRWRYTPRRITRSGGWWSSVLGWMFTTTSAYMFAPFCCQSAWEEAAPCQRRFGSLSNHVWQLGEDLIRRILCMEHEHCVANNSSHRSVRPPYR